MKQVLCFALSIALLFLANDLSAQGSLQNGSVVLSDTSEANKVYRQLDSLIDQGAIEEGIRKAAAAEKVYREKLGSRNKQLADLLHTKGVLFYYNNDLENARKSWEECVDIRESLPEGASAETTKTYNNLGSIYYARGDYENAQKYIEKALNIAIKIRGENHPSLSDYYFNLGTLCRESGTYEKAVKYSRKAVSITRQKHEDNHPDLAECYKELGNTFKALGRYDSAFYYLNEGLAMMKLLKGEEAPELWFYHSDLGVCLEETGQSRKALFHLDKASYLLSKAVGRKHREIANLLINKGNSFTTLGDHAGAISAYEEALSILYQTVGKNDPSVYIIFNNLGIVYNNQGDGGKAMQYFEKSLSYYYGKYGSDHPFVPKFIKNIGLVLQDQGEYEAARQRFEEALKIQKHQLGEKHKEVARVYLSIADNLFLRDSIGQSIEFATKALQITQKAIDGNDHADLIAIFQNMGVYEEGRGNLKQSQVYFEKAADMSRRLFGTIHPKLARAYRSLGKSHRQSGNYNKASHYLSEALYAIGYKEGLEIGSPEILSPIGLFEIFDQRGMLERDKFLKESTDQNLFSSYQWYKKARNSIRYELKRVDRASKPKWIKDAHRVLCNATSTNLLLYKQTNNISYLSEAFTFSERSKATLLYEAMQEANALQVAGIPDGLLAKEYDLRVDIAYYEKQQQELLIAGKADTDAELLTVRDSLFDLNRRLDRLKTRFETSYPAYYRAKYALPTVELQEVQQQLLEEGQSLVEYMVGDSSISIFLVRPDKFEVIEVERDFPLEEWVEDMTKRGLYGFYTLPQSERSNRKAAESVRKYTIAAQKLYEKLWAPIAEKVTERVVVIPDGVLGYLPFEALLEGAPPREGVFSQYPYLVFRHQLSYSYSATLLKEMKEQDVEGNSQMLAMAPFYRGDIQALEAYADSSELFFNLGLRDSLASLPASGEEVALIAKLWNGKAVYGDTASLSLFRQQAPFYSMLHLSTHGKADDRLGDYAYLALGREGAQETFDKLYARDLYNMKLNAELVFLSACETSIGRLRRGEGIVSLARAFAYAGAKSMVTTLWKVEDEKAKALSVAFYGNLLKGMTKDQALQRAKLDYLNNQKGRGDGAHPFFWAGFIGIGDMGAVR